MDCDFIGDLVFHFFQFDEVLLLVTWCFNVDLVLNLRFFHVLKRCPMPPLALLLPTLATP